MKEFTSLGGIVLILNEEERPRWYGLVALFNKLENGDVTLFTASGTPRSANREDLMRYMRETFPSDFLKLGKPDAPQELPRPGKGTEPAVSPRPSLNERPQPSAPDDEALVNVLLSLLDTSPMKLLPAGKIIEMLAAKNLDVPSTRLLACVSRFHGQFHVYPAGKDTLIQRAGR